MRNRKLWALAALALAAAIAAVTTLHAPSVRHDAPAFLARSLGAETPGAALTRVSAGGIRTAITPAGLTFRNGGAALSLVSLDTVSASGAHPAWTLHASGALRQTPFGNEAIVFQSGQIEQLMTVGKRVGSHTWSWRIAANTGYPRVGDDGYVAFIKDHAVRQDLLIKPVVIFDAQGRDITPQGLRWQVARDGRGWLLQLALDDSSLPVPYVIDPTLRGAGTGVATTTANGVNPLTGTPILVNKPSGVAAGDLVVAMVNNSGDGVACVAGTCVGENHGGAVVMNLRVGPAGAQFTAVKTASQTLPETKLTQFARIMQGGEFTGATPWELYNTNATVTVPQSWAVIATAYTGVQEGSVAGQPGMDIVNSAAGALTSTAPKPRQENELVVWGFGVKDAGGGGGAFTDTGNGSEADAAGVASTSGTLDAAVDLLYLDGVGTTTPGTAITAASVTYAPGGGGVQSLPLSITTTFRVTDVTIPTASNFRLGGTNQILFDLSDGTGVGVAPTWPNIGAFKATINGGAPFSPTSVAVALGVVTLTFPAATFATPGSVQLSYSNSGTSTTLPGATNYTTTSGTMTVLSTTPFPSSGAFVVTGQSSGAVAIAYVVTYTGRPTPANTTFTGVST